MIFVVAALPMLVKARRSQDLGSYSFGNIALANTGNLVYSIYVVSLPVGPIWVLHGFYVASTGLMLFWYLRYRSRDAGAAPPPAATRRPADNPVASLLVFATPSAANDNARACWTSR